MNMFDGRTKINCPRRTFPVSPRDTWNSGVCSHCGSMDPVNFLKAVNEGMTVTPSDKNSKIYLGKNQKFYFKHFNHDQKTIFIQLMNSKRLNVSGKFTVLPYFVKEELVYKEGYND